MKNWVLITFDNCHKLKIGQEVMHDSYGHGKILNIRPDFKIAQIEFDNVKNGIRYKDLRCDGFFKVLFDDDDPLTKIRWYHKGKLESLKTFEEFKKKYQNIDKVNFKPFKVKDIYEKCNKDINKTLDELKKLIIGQCIKIYILKNDKYININKELDQDFKWFEDEPVESVEIGNVTTLDLPYYFELSGGFGICPDDLIVQYKPKIIKSPSDPYGEEDWGDDYDELEEPIKEFWNPFKKKNLRLELDPYGEEDWGDENNADIKYLVRDNLYKMLDAYIHETNKYKYIKYKMYLKRKNGNYYHIGKFICDKYGKILNGGFSWVILTNAMKPLYKLKKKNIIFLEKFNDEEVKMIDNSDKVYNGLIYRRLSEIYK